MSSTRKRHGNFTYHWFDLVDIAWHQILEKVLKRIWIPNLIYFIWMMNKFGRSQRLRFLIFFFKFSLTIWKLLPSVNVWISIWTNIQRVMVSAISIYLNAEVKNGQRCLRKIVNCYNKRRPQRTEAGFQTNILSAKAQFSLKSLKVRCANQWSSRQQDFIDTWKRSLVPGSSSKIPSNDWFGFLLSQSKNEPFWSD